MFMYIFYFIFIYFIFSFYFLLYFYIFLYFYFFIFLFNVLFTLIKNYFQICGLFLLYEHLTVLCEIFGGRREKIL
jgi:hypothetical protein